MLVNEPMWSLFEIQYFGPKHIYLNIFNFNGNMDQKLGKMSLLNMT